MRVCTEGDASIRMPDVRKPERERSLGASRSGFRCRVTDYSMVDTIAWLRR